MTIPHLKWIVFVPMAGLLAWRIITLNLADHYAQSNDPESVSAALNWRADHPTALLYAGMSRFKEDPKSARAYLEAATRNNPTDGRGLAMLGMLYEAGKDPARARKALELADRLSPQRTDVQGFLSNYWIQAGDVPQGLRHLTKVMTNNPSEVAKHYPMLLGFAEQERYRPAFQALMAKPLTWWPGFFVYAATNAIRPDTVRALYQMQGKGPNAASDNVLAAYLARLQREGAWMEAYFAWLNSLDKDQLAQLGNIYNGGFELRISNIGYDWRVPKQTHVAVDTASSYGVVGSKALRVSFNGQRAQPVVLVQQTVLAPGRYNFRGRARLDGLKSEKGLQWSMVCVGQPTPFGASERFTGADQWRHFSTQFTVPPGCPAQVLRLEVVGSVALDYDVDGMAWFDDLSIQAID